MRNTLQSEWLHVFFTLLLFNVLQLIPFYGILTVAQTRTMGRHLNIDLLKLSDSILPWTEGNLKLPFAESLVSA